MRAAPHLSEQRIPFFKPCLQAYAAAFLASKALITVAAAITTTQPITLYQRYATSVNQLVAKMAASPTRTAPCAFRVHAILNQQVHVSLFPQRFSNVRTFKMGNHQA